MTFPSSTSPDLPPGTISTTTKAMSANPSPVSSSHLRTHLPNIKISKSASKSFSPASTTPTHLLSTRSTINVSSRPPNAYQSGNPSPTDISSSYSLSSNKRTNLRSASPSTPPDSSPSHTLTTKKQTSAESQTSTPLLTTQPFVFAQDRRLFLDRHSSNISAATRKENSCVNSSATRGDDFTGPVVMPVVGNKKEVNLRQRQMTISSFTQLEASTAAEGDSKQDRLGQWSTENSLREPSNSSSLTVISMSSSGYLSDVTSGPLNSSLSGLRWDDHILSNVTSYPAAVDNINSSPSMSHFGAQITPFSVDLLATRLSNVSTSSPKNVSSIDSSMPSITSVAPTTSVPEEDLSADYQADVYDVFTEDYVASTSRRNATSGNDSTDLDLPSLRKKFLFQFTNMTNPPTSALPNTSPLGHSTPFMAKKTTAHRPTLPIFDPSIDEDPQSFAASSIDNSTSDLTTSTIPYTTPLEEITAPILLSRNITSAASTTSVANLTSAANITSAANVTSAPNVTSNVTSTVNPPSAVNVTSRVSHIVNKEQLQFPGITLKVSHVLIPKQKRSRYSYNFQNMRIELPKTESLNKAPPSVPKTSKNSNCTRFPVLVVTAADTESKEKVNLTEERYDCEFSSQIQSSTRQKEPVDGIRTYYGGYVFRYTIPKASNGSNSTGQSSTEVARTTDMTTAEDGDDYYPSYGEYLESGNGSSNSGKRLNFLIKVIP